MDCSEEESRVQDLLRHTGEFITYFELAERKMIAWQNAIAQQSKELQNYTEIFKQELEVINSLLANTGINQFKESIHKTLMQGEGHLQILEHNSNQLIDTLQQQQQSLNTLTEQCLAKIEQQAASSSEAIAAQCAQYDAYQFHRIASESCDHVEKAALDAVNKSNKLFRRLHVRFGGLALIMTVLSTFLMVLYLSDELPWEMHHQAMNERQAGKVLLQAWPKLSQEEKAKILNDDNLAKG